MISQRAQNEPSCNSYVTGIVCNFLAIGPTQQTTKISTLKCAIMSPHASILTFHTI
jgi:hypothetical protein